MKELTIIAGNCILENIDTSIKTAEFLIEQADVHGFNLIYKSSFKKDNRSSEKHYTGPPLEESLHIFSYLKSGYGLQILSDLEEERSELSDLQYTLVGKIAAARRDRLAELPLPDVTDLETDEIDLGLAMLEKILGDLKEQMKLLPETANRIRQGVSIAPAEGSSPE